jgi:hypothetical protein
VERTAKGVRQTFRRSRLGISRGFLAALSCLCGHHETVRNSQSWKVAVLGGAFAGASLLAGCSMVVPDYQDGTRPTQPAAAARAHCPSSAAQLPPHDDLGRMVGPGQLPNGFRPTHAVRCTWSETYLDDAATRAEVTVEESRSAVITPILSASLELPDQEFAPHSHVACSAVATAPTYLILVDAEGEALAPRLPESPCGDPRDEVARALADLQWTAHRTYRFETPVTT